MTVLKTSLIRRSLCQKGFTEIRDRDHIFFHYLNDCGEKTVAWTKYSHSTDEVADQLIKKMAKQTQLSKKQFEDLINCPLSAEEYKKILEEKGFL